VVVEAEVIELEAAAEDVVELEVDVVELEGGDEGVVEVKTSVSAAVAMIVLGL